MNHWPFIIAAYAITLAAVLGLIGWSFLAMRRAERASERERGWVKAKNQRLTLLLLAAGAVFAAVMLAMSALKDQASYFYAPADVQRLGLPLDRAVRIGGMVQSGSIQRAGDGLTIRFIVHDESPARIPVQFRGIVPDLFKEGSGVVAEGRFLATGLFVASEILAKHDENYMPPQLAGEQHRSDTLE